METSPRLPTWSPNAPTTWEHYGIEHIVCPCVKEWTPGPNSQQILPYTIEYRPAQYNIVAPRYAILYRVKRYYIASDDIILHISISRYKEFSDYIYTGHAYSAVVFVLDGILVTPLQTDLSLLHKQWYLWDQSIQNTNLNPFSAGSSPWCCDSAGDLCWCAVHRDCCLNCNLPSIRV